MIIPTHWAEAEITYRSRHRRDTRIKRMGWSMTSYDDALAMAEQRCQEALKAKHANPDVPWRELKIAYNGADGMPIREEVLERVEAYTITRNAYGAACLNTPNVLFVDIDVPPRLLPFRESMLWNSYALFGFGMGAIVGGFLFVLLKSRIDLPAGGMVTIGAVLGYIVSVLRALRSVEPKKRQDDDTLDPMETMQNDCLEKLKMHVADNPNWNWRVYRTPHGMRLLATHTTFDPRSEDVQQCFDFFGADYLYASMCKLQNCFRARVSPKPWRMGMAALEPRTVWPLSGEPLKQRHSWVADYESEATKFASCRFLCEIGSGVESMDVKAVVAAHDQMSQAHSQLTLA